MLKSAGLKVSLTELLTLHEAMQARVCDPTADDFYHLARTCLIKDEGQFDRFDQVFSAYVEGLEIGTSDQAADIPEEWLRRQAELYLSAEERAEIESLGGFDKLMKTLAERIAEQRERHQGGNKWIGTGGTSPFGAYGYNPEGIRIGQDRSRHRRAVKVWDKREFRNLDSDQALETRNLQVALRRLRQLARTGAAEELDMDATISSTARNGGLLDLNMVPERHNAVKVLLFLDVGGSMDDHVAICQQLFAAARSEFKHLEFFYFHNFVYERFWTDNARRHDEQVLTTDLMRT